MRLERLDLVRYGHFTDRSIDFGPREEGKPDFHLIYGPNEAGKSTLFSAWLDFLYGIPTQSPYNFLHEYKVMRVSAKLSLASGTLILNRIKKPSGSLLDENDQIVGDGFLAPDLGGLDREGYRSMFSLDETSLEQGGEAILASKGDVGQMLFSASAGLSDLAQRLDGLRQDGERFHKSGSRSSQLVELKRKLDELKSARDEIDLAASDYARAVSELDAASRLHEQAIGQRAELRLRLDTANRRLSALPMLARLDELGRELAAMEEPAPPQPGWGSEIATIRRQDVELQTSVERIERELADIERQLGELPDRDPVLDHAESIEGLATLAGRAANGEDDLPNRMLERERSSVAIADSLRGLDRQGEAEPARLLLPARTTGLIKELMASHSAMLLRQDTARLEVQRAEQALADAQRDAGVEAAPVQPVEPGTLSHLLERLSAARATDYEERLSRATLDVDHALALLDRRVIALAPWQGSHDDLGRLAIPSQVVLADLAKRLADASTRHMAARTEIERLVGERAVLEAERISLTTLGGLVTDDEAAGLRAEREAAWSDHRAVLDAASADKFRRSLDLDDGAIARRFAQVVDLARLRSLDQQLAAKQALSQLAQKQAIGCAETEGKVRDELVALIGGASKVLPADMGIVTFQSWCVALGSAQEALAAFRQAERERMATSAVYEKTRALLRDALQAAGQRAEAGEPLDVLIERGQTFADGTARRESLLAALRARQIELERRTHERDAAEKAYELWRQQWAGAGEGTWLAGLSYSPTVGEMAEILEQLQRLATALTEHQSIDDRLGKIERDVTAFADALRPICLALEFDAQLSSRQLYARLAIRLRQAREKEIQRRALQERQTSLGKERSAIADQQTAIDARIALMTSYYLVTSLDEVEQKIALLERRAALIADLAERTAAVAESLGAANNAEMQALMADADRQSLLLEIERLKPQCDQLDEQTSSAHTMLVKASERLASFGGDAEAARLAEARRTVLLEIEEGARRYLEHRLGAIATDQALRLYRDRHRSSMMTRASEAFVQLTRGNYRGLSTHRDGKTESLVAIAQDGSSKAAGDAGELSKGTQFQLYLALRVAGYLENAATRTPVPFIADDVMESFDEGRSEEALAQLANMAGTGQVIYLTHHRHICDIARAICPTVSIHNL